MSPDAKPLWKNSWRWCGFIFPTLIALVFLISPLGGALATFGFDLLYLFRPAVDPATVTELVILSMDEESRGALNQDPSRRWDRAVHARLLRELKARGAKVVAFDILFAEPSPDSHADEEFSEAIRQHGNVVLAAIVLSSKETGRPPSSRILPPISSLSSNANWGVVEFPDESSIIRNQLNYTEYTNFAWQVAEAFGQAPANRLVVRWLNYYGPGQTLPTVSYHRALEPRALPSDFFEGKAVFIGGGRLITSEGQSSDLHATPFSRWHRGQTSGVEIQATAFLNLVRGDWLAETSLAAQVLILLVSGGLLGFGLPRFRAWTAAAIAVGAALLVAAGSVGLAWGNHLVIPWLIICAVQIPCALGWYVLGYTNRLTREKEHLERSAALAESVEALAAGTGPQAFADVRTDPSISPSRSSAVPEAQAPPIPNHRLLRRIGQGSYGEVWLARDEIGSYHAVKVVYRRTFSSATPYEREFRGIQKFTPISRSHPGFVHVLHVGRNDPEGYFFCIMELGDDESSQQQIEPATYSPHSLARLLERGRLALADCIELGLDLTSALDFLHQHELVHRDIKPSNIIFVNRKPKFADIGLVTGISKRGKDATLVGTEGYLAPEGPGTAAADIYSLGKVLYEACTGRDRQEFPSLSGTLVASGDQALPLFNDLILKACQPDPKDRYVSASQVHADLLEIRKTLAAIKQD